MDKTKYIGILVICFLLSSCNDFLNQTPRTGPVLLNYFKTKKDFEYAVVGMYKPLQVLYNNESEFGLNTFRSDNLTFIYDVGDRGSTELEDIDKFTVKTTNWVIEDNWDRNYLIISRANQVLAALSKTQLELSQTFRDKVKGQALFLRALSYFDLVRLFGHIPLYLEPVTDYESSFKPQVPAEQVYQQIINDAKEAAELLPNKWDVGPGRASAAAAYTLLGNVYLTLRQYSNAEDALMKVVNMKKYGLLSNFGNIFKPSNEGNKEMIFVVEFGTGFTANPQASSFPVQLMPFLRDLSIITGVQQNRGNCCFGLAPTPDLIKAFGGMDTKDERFDVSIGFYNGPSPVSGVPYDPIPYVNKYLHPHSNYAETDQNWPIYRYAQVLLMLSRATYEQGRLNEARKYLNMVRRRAGLNNSTASNTKELGKAILHEFRLEFAFENKRWHSLVRTGNAVEVMNTLGNRIKANPTDYYFPSSITNSYFNGAYNITEDNLIYPIPEAEININAELEQNPGY